MQNINLYHPIFRQQKLLFSVTVMLRSLLFCIGLLVLFYLFSWQQAEPLRKKLKQIDQDIILLTARTDKLEQENKIKKKSELLEREVQSLAKKLAERKQILNLLDDSMLGNTTGFSDYFEAFSRQHITGIWLTRIAIERGGNELQLKGKAVKPELLPIYIKKLAKEKVLENIVFNNMNMELTELSAEKSSSSLTFQVDTN